MSDYYDRVGLTVRDAAVLLLMSEPQIRRRLTKGTLTYAVRPRLIDVESVRRLFPEDETRPLRELVLQRLLAGEIESPKPLDRYARPSILFLLAAALPSALPLECAPDDDRKHVRYSTESVRKPAKAE